MISWYPRLRFIFRCVFKFVLTTWKIDSYYKLYTSVSLSRNDAPKIPSCAGSSCGEWLLYIFLLTICKSASAQALVPIGHFSLDSIHIGTPVQYTMYLYHDKKIQLVFPDSAYGYYPFELIGKKYFPTITRGNLSLDSVTYQLRTFELQEKIIYQLPVFVLNPGGDSSVIFANKDSVYLLSLTAASTGNARLKEHISFHPVSLRKNYFYYGAIVLMAAISALILFLFFRKKLFRRYKLYTIRKAHNSFLKNFERIENEFVKSRDLSVIENALSLWKIYLSKLEDSPINTYTTTEIITLFKNQDLEEGLQIIDRSIYRGLISGEPEKAFSILKKFSNHRYQKIKKTIING
jgi:hypothetical protein